MLITMLIFYFVTSRDSGVKIGNFLLMEIHNGVYYLFENDGKSVLKKGILHYYRDKNYYILYGIDVELCDKDSIYFILKDQRIYLIIDDKKNDIFIFNDINDFHKYAQKINIKIKDTDYIDNFLKKNPNNIDLAKKDGCI